MMDITDSLEFIDKESANDFSYVWKKKKAAQKAKHVSFDETDFRQRCLDSLNGDESSYEDSLSESRTYFGKEESSSGDDAPEIIEEEDDFSEETSLSPRAPLVSEEDEVTREVNCENLEIIVSESDHERIALTSALTVREEEVVIGKQVEMESETIIRDSGSQDDKHEAVAGDVKPRRRVHFKDDSDEKRKCNKNSDVPPLTDDGSEIGVVFTEDVTIRVSFIEGKVIVEESDERTEKPKQDEHTGRENGSGFVNKEEHQPTAQDNEADELTTSNILNEEENTIQDTVEDKYTLCKDYTESITVPLDKVFISIDFESKDSENEDKLNILTEKSEYNELSIKNEEFLNERNAMTEVIDCGKECTDRLTSLESQEFNLKISADSMFEKKSLEETPYDSASTLANNKLEHDLVDSEKSNTSIPLTNTKIDGDTLSLAVDNGTDSAFENKEKNGPPEGAQPISEHSNIPDLIKETPQTSPVERFDTNMFYLHDIIEEESCSDIENEDYTSSDSTVFVDCVDNLVSNVKSKQELLSNDSDLKNYSKIPQSEDSSNSDSSLEKCEVESLEKDNNLKRKSNPILSLYEMQEKEEIFESSLGILQEFRSNLIPGITSASNWISCCDSDELSIGVVDGEEEEEVAEEVVKGEESSHWECGRWTALSTSGAATRGTSVAEMLSTYPPAPSQHGWQYTLPSDSGSESESVQGDSLDTVISVRVNGPRLVDREIQVNSECERCESHGSKQDISCDKEEDSEQTTVLSVGDNSSAENTGEVSAHESTHLNNCDKDLEIVCDSVELETKVKFDDTVEVVNREEGDTDLESVESPKKPISELFPIKRSTNALDNLPLIFPHVRGVIVSKPINKFENLFKSSPEKGKSDGISNSSNNDKLLEFKEESTNTAVSTHSSFYNIDVCSRVDLKTDNLFQFNVGTHEGVTSFSEDVRSSSEDEMKQKKKHEDRHQEEAVGTSNSELCNGYHKGVLKSALKRSSSKKKKKNRVQFDESLNKFFDADYVILIREEPDDFEGDYEFGGCDCGEDFCYDECCDEELDEDEFQEPPSPFRTDLCAAFEPPVEFVDQVTLSPPDGYKDTSHYCPHHHPRLPPPPQAKQRMPGEYLLIIVF